MAERTLEAASRQEALNIATQYLKDFRITAHKPDRVILDIRNAPLWHLAFSFIAHSVLPAGQFRGELIDRGLSKWTRRVLKIVIVFPATQGTSPQDARREAVQ